MSKESEEFHKQRRERRSEFLTENEKLIRDAVLFGLDNAESTKTINELFIEFVTGQGLTIKGWDDNAETL